MTRRHQEARQEAIPLAGHPRSGQRETSSRCRETIQAQLALCRGVKSSADRIVAAKVDASGLQPPRDHDRSGVGPGRQRRRQQRHRCVASQWDGQPVEQSIRPVSGSKSAFSRYQLHTWADRSIHGWSSVMGRLGQASHARGATQRTTTMKGRIRKRQERRRPWRLTLVRLLTRALGHRVTLSSVGRGVGTCE
jgi:hypothetical protein